MTLAGSLVTADSSKPTILAASLATMKCMLLLLQMTWVPSYPAAKIVEEEAQIAQERYSQLIRVELPERGEDWAHWRTSHLHMASGHLH